MVDVRLDMPCLRCGMILSADDDGGVACGCGAVFSLEDLAFYSRPGFYREWLAALSCACGLVDHYDDDGVTIRPHRCSSGGVMWMGREN